ncbi:MAG: tyrosine-type recombinase/integrase [Thaumarchaeota archaeon]|jgi:integrase|nr:tyrosine-type recombinase/integrase [Nitrososphaerota archaeon]MBT6468609.1 tyrosine-type recombinase/integrase [Nitrososphaerota archaeon]
MSYLQNQITIEQYIDSITNRSKKNHVGSILNIFNSFCNQKYNKSNQNVLDDLIDEIKKTHSNDKVYVLFNHFKEWLLVDHPEIVYFMGKDRTQKRTIKARHPNSVKQYLIKIRSIFEEIGNIEINSRLFNKRVKIPKAEEEDPEPFTKEQMRLLLDRCSNHNKLKYMFLKDTGCRIGELVQIRKRDVNYTKNPIQIKIQSSYTKTKKARIVFVTIETASMLKRLLSKKSDEQLVFGTNEDAYIATGTEKAEFTYYRGQLAKDYPEFGERYQSNNRHKKTVHSIRSFTATQCTEAIDESWGHGYIGHKKYLGQYIRNQDKQAEMFVRSENYLMIYEHIEVVDSDQRVDEMQKDVEKLQKMILILQNTKSV